MADEIRNSDDVLVEFSENNILSVDPNKVFQNGVVRDRLVKHENLVIYANLTARVVPRSKLITGTGVNNDLSESFVDIFEGQINFLKPGGKEYFTTDWTDTQTGKGFNTERGVQNQRVQKTFTDPITGQEFTRETITNKTDSESFGIESISVSLDRAFTPIVNITFTDIRGQTLFEQGPNSPYSAFFQLPYPLFKLTLKGFYGKAVQYQLMLEKFTASFDANSGNYNVTCNFKGRVTALLADITVQEMRAAPYMFSKTYKLGELNDETEPTINTSRGFQILNEVYTEYENEGLVKDTLPRLTLDDLIDKVKNLESEIEKGLQKQNVDQLTHIEEYENVLIGSKSYRNKILAAGGWRSVYLEQNLSSPQAPVVVGNLVYFQYKEFWNNAEGKKEARDKLKEIINDNNKKLLSNKTFGTGGNESIPVDIKFSDFIYRAPAGYEGVETDWFVFENTTRSFDEKISAIITDFTNKRLRIEGEITEKLNDVLIDSLGFKPSIRNLFAILIAQADTFLRLLDETHSQSFSVRSDSKRVSVIKGDNKSSTNSELQEDEFVYPWPHYYITQSKDEQQQFVSTYPGAASVLGQTKGYDSRLWPEVAFVEEFFRAGVIIQQDSLPNYNSPSASFKLIPLSSFDFLEQELYTDPSYVSLNYEIYDRATLNSIYNSLLYRLDDNVSKNIITRNSDVEASNIKQNIVNFLDLNEFLKDQNFNFDSFVSYLEQISPLNNYQLLIRDQFSTEYIRELTESTFSVSDIDTFFQTTYSVDDSTILDSIQSFKDSLKISTQPSLLETYPLINFGKQDDWWVSNNLAGGKKIQSSNDLNYIGRSLEYAEKQNVYSSIETQKFGDTSLFIDNLTFYSSFQWAKNQYLEIYNELFDIRKNNLSNEVSLESPNEVGNSFLLDFYVQKTLDVEIDNNLNNYFLTEGNINYGEEYEGKIFEKQITSIFNTPYFTNAVLNDIKEDIGGNQNAYITSSYLFLNSLPVNSLREKVIEGVTENGTVSWGDFVCKTLNQVSAVHGLPKAWILKYGSIWHRYKRFINEGVDILEDIWDNFDYNFYFNNNNGYSHTYNLNLTQDISGVVLSGVSSFVGQRVQNGATNLLNLGFYPEMINYIQYLITGNFLFNGTEATGFPILDSEINTYLDSRRLILKEIKDIQIIDDTNVLESNNVEAQFWYNYYDLSVGQQETPYLDKKLIIYPSCGGLFQNQTNFELSRPRDIVNNNAPQNGSTRFAWGLSNYGYFEHTQSSFPTPREYMNDISPDHDAQVPFTISSENYSSIEELFDVFSPEVLDYFEQEFLEFTQKTSDLPEDSTITTFQSILREMLIVDKNQITETDDGELHNEIAKVQLQKINTILSGFLEEQISFNFYNPKEINIDVFKSFIGDSDNIDFGSYQFNLPPNIPLAQSRASYPTLWNQLDLQIGFYNETEPLTEFNVANQNINGYITDFFSEFNIEFSSNNIRLLRKIIRIYVSEKIRLGDAFLSSLFIERIRQEIVLKGETLREDFVNQVFISLKKKLPQVQRVETVGFQNDAAYTTDEMKLEQYLVFKNFNDKWISGEDFSSFLLFRDFVFYDIANRDIGDDAILDVNPIISLESEENASASLYTVIGSMLQGNYFNFYGMPAYINFYGVAGDGTTEIPKFSTQEEANNLFGTFTEVDYLDSRPTFLCQYVGETSNFASDLSSETRYGTDSFVLGRTADNPLFSNCTDPKTCNKVVSFVIDFGIENQSIFKGISLDQSQFKNTSESFQITEAMAQSVNDQNVKTQGLNLFNIYKSRSYTCKVEAMGNVCIQPTMYFTLRNVPMFSGPYIILNVEHRVSEGDISTSFTGVRVPFHKLPDINNLVASINKQLVQKVKTNNEERDRRIIRSGFNPESPTELNSVKEGQTGVRNLPNVFPFDENNINNVTDVNKIIIHTTGEIGLGGGANTITNLNTKHKKLGFAGIGFNYVIDRNDVLLKGRDTRFIGAHTQGENQNSIGIAIEAECPQESTYVTNAEGFITGGQRNTLEWSILSLLFYWNIFKYTINGDGNDLTFQVKVQDTENYIVVQDPSNNITKNLTDNILTKIIKGHNDFNNTNVCPCFEVKEAIVNPLGGNLRKKLGMVSQAITEKIEGESEVNNVDIKSIIFDYISSQFESNVQEILTPNDKGILVSQSEINEHTTTEGGDIEDNNGTSTSNQTNTENTSDVEETNPPFKGELQFVISTDNINFVYRVLTSDLVPLYLDDVTIPINSPVDGTTIKQNPTSFSDSNKRFIEFWDNDTEFRTDYPDLEPYLSRFEDNGDLAFFEVIDVLNDR